MGRNVAIIGTRGYPSYYGGFETAVRRLAPFLIDAGWDVTVYGRPGATSANDPKRDSRVRAIETAGFETTSLSTLSFGLTAVLHALRTKPDVVLVMNVANGFWLPLLRFRGIPSVVNVDGIEWERAKWGRLAKSVFRLGAQMTARWANELIADADAISVRWKEEFGRDSLFVPYGGEVPPDLPVMEGLSHRGYILMVARFVPENTVYEFLEAAGRLAARHKIVIVGSSGYGGMLDERAAKLANEHANIQWLGHLSDDEKLHSLWQHAGAYFHGHSVGGTNPALVQAMACGAPIVARDTIYNREVLGHTASYVSSQATDIEAALDAAMDQANDYDPAKVVNRAEQHYSWDGVCSKYEQALMSLLAKDPSKDIPASH